MDLESPPKVHPHCGRKGSLYFMLSRLIFFDGYYYVSVDLASAEDRILYVNLELEEKKLGCRKTTDKPQFLKGLPDAYGAQSHVFDGLLAQTGERSKYLCGVKLDVVMSNGETVCLSSEEIIRTYPEQYNSTIAQLLNIIHNKPEGGRILELGSRGPTSIGFRSRLPDNWKYVGVDIKEGENVTHVGDVHRLSGFIEAQSADIVYSSSVFEHLKAPWLVATECAKVLKRGGHIFVATHNTWPLHEAPWDFWRFTKYT